MDFVPIHIFCSFALETFISTYLVSMSVCPKDYKQGQVLQQETKDLSEINSYCIPFAN